MTDKTPSQKAETERAWRDFISIEVLAVHRHAPEVAHVLEGIEAYQRSLRKLVEDRLKEYNASVYHPAARVNADFALLSINEVLQLIDTVEPPK